MPESAQSAAYRVKLMRLAAILAAAVLVPVTSPGVNYYVAPWGDDGYSGLSWDSAFATLQRAANLVTAGDSAIVADGDYVGFDLRASGTEALPIVFSAYGDSVRINERNSVTPDGINIEDAGWVVVLGFIVSGIERAGIRVAVSDHVTIRDNICSHNGRWGIFTGFAEHVLIEENVCEYSEQEHGIYFSNSADHPRIRGNISHHNNGCGIHMNGDESMGGDGLITDAMVEGNTVFENGTGGGSGINCDGVAQSAIFNNLLYMNHASGISLYRIDASAGSFNDRIYNNTIINAADGRWCLNINSSSTGDTIYNNILINLHPWRGSISVDSSSLADFESDYNILVDRMSNDGGNTVLSLSEWQAQGFDGNSLLADSLVALFLDWAGGDYHLKEGCQAVDSGTDMVLPVVQYDLDSVPRPQGAGFDVGAYEYGVMGAQMDPLRQDGLPGPRVHTALGSVLFGDLSAGDAIRIYDIAGRMLEDTGPLSVQNYLWNPPFAHCGVFFYQVSSPSGDAVARGKFLVLK